MTTFEDLEEDCCLEVFKYLTFAERVRLERVGRRWGRLLARLWLQQRAFAGCLDSLSLKQPFSCHRDTHRIYENDIWFIGDVDTDPYEKLLKRCSNLKAFYWFELKFRLKRGLLSEYCPSLEHIYLRFASKSALGCLFGYNDSPNLSCVQLPLLDSREDPFFADLVLLAKEWRELRVLSITVTGRVEEAALKDLLSPLLPHLREFQLKYYQKRRLPISLLSFITENGLQLRALSIKVSHDIEDKNVHQMVQNLPKSLTSIELYSSPKSITRFLGLNRMEKISWIHRKTVDQDVENYNFFLPNYTLKSLKLFVGLSGGNIGNIPQLYPNLTELEVRCQRPALLSFGDDFFSCFRRLRRIVLNKVVVNDEDIRKLLKANNKLCEAYLFNCPLSPDIIGLFTHFGERFPRRVVRVYLDHNFHDKYRSGRKVVVENNVRFYFGKIKPYSC